MKNPLSFVREHLDAFRSGQESSPIRLERARIYVLPTRIGWFMIVTLLLIFTASINYNISLGYALLFMLAGVGVVHIVQSWRTLLKLQVKITPEKGEIFAGEEAAFRLALTNAESYERPAIELQSDYAGPFPLAWLDVPAQTQVDATFRLTTTQRGWLQPGRFRLETRQPLGWIRAWVVFEFSNVRTLVFPQPAGELPIPVAMGYSAEGTPSSTRGEDDFVGLRSYQQTDSPSRIAWKSLARGQGQLMTKQFSGNTSPDLALNWSDLPVQMSDEARIAQLVRWVLDARQMGARMVLNMPGSSLGPGQSEAHYQACLERLALWHRVSD